MRTIFAAFDFKSADLAAEEKNYIETHVRLAKQFPGLRQYITGRLSAPSGKNPPYYRAATLTFDDAAAFEAAFRKSPVAKPLVEDGKAHLTNVRWLELDSAVIVPFESKAPGMNCFMMASEFDLKLNGGDLAAAEKRYLDHHTYLARRLPGLRAYAIGRFVQPLGAKADRVASFDRLRMAIIVFDDFEALRAAYRSPVGQELAKDEEETIANPRVYRIDATVQV
jgi:uncharacterized protein (TIGR02118 family)